MPSSGGSVSDAPINKVVDGQEHQLSYITPVEAQYLVSQGGKPTMTNEGVMAYPGHHGVSGQSMGVAQGTADGPGTRDHHGGGGGPIVTTPSKADLGTVDAEDEYLAPDKDH